MAPRPNLRKAITDLHHTTGAPTRQVNLRTLAATLQQLATALAHPTTNGTIGDQVRKATRDGQPGIPATAYDNPNVTTSQPTSTTPDANQHPTAHDHDRFNHLTEILQLAADDTRDIVTNWRSDRTVVFDDVADPDQWCRHCLATIGVCEPVHAQKERTCRWCHEFKQRNKWLPPAPILEHRHRGGRVTQDLINRHRPIQPKKRKKKR